MFHGSLCSDVEENLLSDSPQNVEFSALYCAAVFPPASSSLQVEVLAFPIGVFQYRLCVFPFEFVSKNVFINHVLKLIQAA